MGIFGFIGRRRSLLESGVLSGATDRHSHLLYGVDDGVKTLEEAPYLVDVFWMRVPSESVRYGVLHM